MIKQVIVYRRDLKMRKGKIAAQCAHASMKVFFDRGEIVRHQRMGWPQTYSLSVPLSISMKEWVEGIFTKIVLTVDSEEDLLRAYALAKKAKLPCALVTDVGKTEFHGRPTHTCIAIGPAPAPKIDKITGPAPVGAIPTRMP